MMLQQSMYMKHRITAHHTRNERDMKYEVVEIFQSINGEGMKAGELAVFLRLKGCNLSCRYCDTTWANAEDAECRKMDEEEILDEIKQYKVRNVTVTGGEPLLRRGMRLLLTKLTEAGFYVEIETNGSVPLQEFAGISPKLSFTMDYKLGGSGMEDKMDTGNFSLLTKRDTVKFVVSDNRDMERAYDVSKRFLSDGQCNLLISPVFGEISLEEIVEFMKAHHWTEARMQLQMHKIIWNPEKRGV